MEKKWLSVAGLWLALIALVFIYTDRNEYTWRYEGDELGQIVISSEEADARQTQADAAMALEQQAAQARTDANLWGTDEDSVEPFRQAQNEDGGLNLTWGRYEVTVDYDGAAKADVRVVSAGYQAFIENGEVHEEMEEENGRFEQLSFGFNLTDSTPDLYLASENPEDIVGVTVHKAGAGVFSADLCAYAALVGAVLTVLLVTRVQNMDDHQSLAVAPFYLLGCFLCALLVSDLPWAWPRRILAVSAGVLCALNFGACSQLLPVVFPSGFYSGLYFYVDSPRNDLQQIAEVNAWLRENCTGENSAYMICHGVVYSPDVFRVSALPDETIREILPYGVCNPGNDAFPKELFTAQVVLTCTPFDPNNHTEKMDAAFLENQEKYAPFEIAAEFDMGNGYTITAYRRIKAPTVAELDTYRSYLAEEDARFPYNFSAVWDEMAAQFANNG